MGNALQVATEYYTRTQVVFHICLQEQQRVINRSSVLLIYDEISFALLMTYLMLPAG